MEAILAVVAVLSLALTLILGIKSAKTSALAAAAADRSAVAAQRSVDVSVEQLQSAAQAQRAATQPYVWADLQPRDDAGILVLVVGNSGPTVATDVFLTFDPPLGRIVPNDQAEQAERIENGARASIRSIAPGRTLTWNLGVAHTYFPHEGEDPVPELTVSVVANGPWGRLDELSYVIALEDLRHQAARATGLAVLEAPLKKRIGDHLETIAREVARRSS